jgi:hypothetical protein
VKTCTMPSVSCSQQRCTKKNISRGSWGGLAALSVAGILSARVELRPKRSPLFTYRRTTVRIANEIPPFSPVQPRPACSLWSLWSL